MVDWLCSNDDEIFPQQNIQFCRTFTAGKLSQMGEHHKFAVIFLPSCYG